LRRHLATDILSDKINSLNMACQTSELWEDVPLRHAVLSRAFPKSLQRLVGLETMIQRLPEDYLKAVFGCVCLPIPSHNAPFPRARAHTHTHTHTHTSRLSLGAFVCPSPSRNAPPRTHTHTHAHIYTHTHTYTDTHTHTHTLTHSLTHAHSLTLCSPHTNSYYIASRFVYERGMNLEGFEFLTAFFGHMASLTKHK
jgi:hypothetical protein